MFLALLLLAMQTGSCSAASPAVTLQGKRVTVAVPAPAEAGSNAILHLDGVQIDKHPGGYYEVRAGGALVGNLTVYGVTPSMSRDLTYRLGPAKRDRNGEVAVTFVPRGAAAGSSARVRIRRVRIAVANS